MSSCPLLTAPGVEEGESQGHVEGEDAQQVDNVQEREDEAYLQQSYSKMYCHVESHR